MNMAYSDFSSYSWDQNAKFKSKKSKQKYGARPLPKKINRGLISASSKRDGGAKKSKRGSNSEKSANSEKVKASIIPTNPSSAFTSEKR